MARGVKIVLEDVAELVLIEFIDSLDTRSLASKDKYAYMFRSFVSEVGLGNNFTQEDINTWMSKHEHRNPNNNCRAFLIKFGEYIDEDNVDATPFFSRPIKSIQPPKNRKIPDSGDIETLFKACKTMKSKHITPLFFEFYLRLVWEAGLRKSEPLKTTLRDFVLENEIPKLLIRGKGNRHRWVVISDELFGDIIDFYNSRGIVTDNKIFSLSVKNIEDVYGQVCRIANKLTNTTHFGKMKKYESKIYNKYTGQVIGSRLNTYIVPTYSLHKFRTARATMWYQGTDKQEGVKLMEIQRRLGHQSTSTTQRYIDEAEDQMLKVWGNESNTDPEEKLATQRVEDERQMLLKKTMILDNIPTLVTPQVDTQE